MTLVAFVVAALLVADLRYNRLDGSRAVLDTLLMAPEGVEVMMHAAARTLDLHIALFHSLILRSNPCVHSLPGHDRKPR